MSGLLLGLTFTPFIYFLPSLPHFTLHTAQYLHARFTLHQEEIGDHIQVPAIQSNFNRSLGFLVPEVHDEAIAAFEEAFPLEGNGKHKLIQN